MSWRRGAVALAIAVVAVAGLVLAARWWLFSRTHVGTDDAYVHADVAMVTPRIAGTVDRIYVDANWEVRRGQLLVRIDPAEQRLRLQRAEAALAHAREGVRQARAAVRASDAGLALAEADLEQARIDHSRAAQLAGGGVVPTERLDRARTALRVAEARVASARGEATRARATLGIPDEAPDAEAAAVREAQAARDEAALLLSYTRIRAPISGIVTRRAAEVGERVQPGQALMAIVPVARTYVEANFKETQLTDVRVGQPATVVADIYPDVVFRGRVDGLAPGTGAAFSLLPPENATGNWVKVVQRVPVRIRLDEPPTPDHPLRVGLSVVATIDTSRRDGPMLTPLSETDAADRRDPRSAAVAR
ncbi:MAG TPA: HlyD family secretion protein [Candidatus Binatia bacterium]|nr:HlyD family secretion protein [Candidatus Binatia bacterium]